MLLISRALGWTRAATGTSIRTLTLRIAALIAIGAGAIACQPIAQAEQAVRIPPPAQDEKAGSAHTETVVFAGGCFWGVQGVYEHVKGVKQVASGYSGGAGSTAQYETVSGGDTGHAESVRITYDPTQITYGRLLQIFFSVVHNPTELNYQGPDHGLQYRSAVFPQNAEQRGIAQAYIAQLNNAKVFSAPIVTRVEDFKGFYPAEQYHQNYLVLHPDSPYIAINDLPKIDHLKQMFPDVYRSDPVLLKTSAS
jgi:peptide-methionine (S)-S-oxide reductase